MPIGLRSRVQGGESFPRIWSRRALTIPLLHLVTALVLLLLPLLLLVAGLTDLARRRRGAISIRALHVVALSLLMHCAAIWMLFGSWILDGDWDRRLEVWWARGMYRAVESVFRMKTLVEGEDVLDGGPYLLFARHSSILDPLLPLMLIAGPYRRRVRYVAKRDLLIDPCVDIIGHRLPMAFVRRGTPRHDREIAVVVHLLDGLEPNDVVLLYPEGTRFTERKRARFLSALEQKDPESWEQARRIENLLPPHAGGLLGLLDKNPGLDVVFCVNTGLEEVNHWRDLFSGGLLGATVHVRFWRVRYSDIPKARSDQIEWFYGWWTRLDRWITDHHQEWREI